MALFARSAVLLLLFLYPLASSVDAEDKVTEDVLFAPQPTHFGGHPVQIVRDPEDSERVLHIVEGPWGKIQYYPIHLEVPERYLEYLEPTQDRTEWIFPNSKPNDVSDFLATVGARTNGQPVKYFEVGGDVLLYPSDEIVEGLTADQRAAIAEKLAQDSRNMFHRYPAVIDSDDEEQWFIDAGLDAEEAARVAGLCYKRGGVTLFSDLPLVLASMDSLESRNVATRAITRTRSLIARLSVTESTNLDGVVDYWTAGHKRKSVLTLLESVNAAPEVDRIDITHLLPPIPRMLVYTYPSLADVAQDEKRDCHWTCRNFFRSTPSPVLRSAALRQDAMLESWEQVEDQPEFGDMIVFADAETDDLVHSMIYIAADIVFTKNGSSIFKPWELKLFRSVLAHYSFNGPINTEIWRSK